MRKLIFKLLLLLLSLFTIVQIIKQQVPFYYGDGVFKCKYNDLLKLHDRYEVFFVGSSHVNRHINTPLFSEITGKSAFNLGNGGMECITSMYHLEHISQLAYFPNLKYVVFHLNEPVNPINDKNLSSIKARYGIDNTRFSFAMRYFYARGQFNHMKNYVYAYITNLFSIGQLKALIFNSEEACKFSYTDKQGYLPYIMVEENQFQINYKKKKGTHLMKGHQFITKDKNPNITKADNILIKELERLEELFAAKNIQLIILVPPNKNFHHKAPQFKSLYMGDGKRNPSYFDVNYRYNAGHLNSEGADIYTKKLAVKFKALLQ